MTLQPRSKAEIKADLETALRDEISGLTNFTDGSFNDRLIDALAERIRDTEIKALSAELAGYPKYAGKELTDADLSRLGITGVDPKTVNEYQRDQQLDELALQVGVTRSTGTRATGTVTFDVVDESVAIPEGFKIGTQPANDGSYLAFRVDADGDGEIDPNSNESVTPDVGEKQVTVDVIADRTGNEYNVGAGAITYIPTPKPGVQSVTNPVATTDGTDRQSNAQLRDDIVNAVFESAGGGTKLGIEKSLESAVNEVRDVSVIQFTDKKPPYAEVVVDGGNEEVVREEINRLRPVGIEHLFVRPTVVRLGTRAQLLSPNTDTTEIVTAVKDYLSGLEIDNTFSRSQLLKRILDASEETTSVPSLSTYINIVENDIYEYTSGTDVYDLQYGPLGQVTREQHLVDEEKTQYRLNYSDVSASSVSVTALVGNERKTLTRGSNSDFTVIDDDNDGTLDTVALTGATQPDPVSSMEVSYTHNQAVVDTVTDSSGTEYTLGTDVGLVDTDNDGAIDAIDFSVGGATPSDGTRFSVSYRPQRSFGGDLAGQQRVKFDPDVNEIDMLTRSL